MQDDLSKVVNTIAARPLKEHAILAAGPITWQPCSNPYRVVLRWLPHGGPDNLGQLVVHTQVWPTPKVDAEGNLDLSQAESGFTEGNYFSRSQLVEAVSRWVQRLTTDMVHLKSVYRRLASTGVAGTLEELLPGSKT